MGYIQHLTGLQGPSPPAPQQPWRWPSQCPPAGAWSRLLETVAPCTLGPAGGLRGGKEVVRQAQEAFCILKLMLSEFQRVLLIPRLSF